MGQAADQNKSEAQLLSYIKKCASSENNTKALEEMKSLPPLPYDQNNFGKSISISRKWGTYYGCSLYGEHNIDCINLTAFFRPEYSLLDFIHYFKGQDLYYTNTASDVARYELYTTKLAQEIPSVDVPVYIVQGSRDLVTSTDVAHKYYEMLDAPYKEFHVIEKTAHNVIYEQPDAFAEILLKVKGEN